MGQSWATGFASPARTTVGTDADRWGRLADSVRINFEGDGGGGKKTRGVGAFIGRTWWGMVRGLGNAGARMTNCPMRVHVHPNEVSQPTPNLVDAAVAEEFGGDVIKPEVHGLGAIVGSAALDLAQPVQKVGRTTGHTLGVVTGINAAVRVSYGNGRIAMFGDQVIIEAATGEFSAPGDSGSSILTQTTPVMIGGLLYAGGDRQTIANRWEHVAALLGVRV